MFLYIFYLFVYSLEETICWQPPTTQRHDSSFNPYIGAAKSAKLINLVQKIKESNVRHPIGVIGKDAIDKETTILTPNIFDSMKLLQKNYDVSRKFNEDHDKKRVNLQFISNPEVLEMYRKQPVRRHEDYADIGNFETRSYKEEALRSGRPALHHFGKPVDLQEFRKHIKLDSSTSSEPDEKNDGDGDSDDDPEDDVRRTVNFRVNEEEPKSVDSGDETDVTLKPEETFDIVKPFIEQMLNNIKDRGDSKEKNKNSKSDEQEDSFDPQKILSSAEKEKEDVERLLLERVLLVNKKDTMDEKEYIGKLSEPTITQEINIYEKKQEQNYVQNNVEQLKPIFLEEVETKSTWGKKESGKYGTENISKEKQRGNGNILQNRSRNIYDDKDWVKKKFPVSKKSFIEPTMTREDIGWDDKGFAYAKDTVWDRKEKKDTGDIEDNGFDRNKENDDYGDNHKNKGDFDMISVRDKKFSSENNKDYNMKMDKNNNNDDSWDRKKTEWGQYNNKNIDLPKNKEDDWDKQKVKLDGWVKEEKKDSWNKKDDWNKKEDNWNKRNDPGHEVDDWNNRGDILNKKNDKWNQKDDDWDKKGDNWNKKGDNWNKKKDNWNKKNNDWNKKENNWNKKNDHWNKKNDDWNKKGDNWNKKKDDWNKKDDDWNKKEDSWNKKNDDWNKKSDDWNKGGDSWNKKNDNWKKKDDNWNSKNIKLDRKLPDNIKRDSGWDLVGLENNKKSVEVPRRRPPFDEKKNNRYSELGSVENLRNKKVSYDEETYNNEEKIDIPKNNYSPKKKSESYVPKFYNNYDKPQKAKRYDSYERNSAPPGLGRTPIPFVGNKAVYAD